MHLEVVTPRGRLAAAEVEEVTAPGVMGEFGVLPGHIPFLAGLKPGVLKWSGAGGAGTLAVGPGFLEVSMGDRIVVLCDIGETPAKIDVAQVGKELAEAQHQLDHDQGGDAGVRAELEDRKAWAEARLAAAGKSL